MATIKPASTFISSRSPIVDSDGNATFFFIKILQGWDTKLQNGLNQIGQILQPIPSATPIDGHTEGIGVTLQFLDGSGVVLAGGIDFARAYLNKNTDNIADGAGSPLAGGRAAGLALVTSHPVPEAHKWVNGLVAGVFTKTQPAFADISGTAAAAQVPPLSALSGSVTAAQVPPLSALSGSVTAAQVPSLSALSGRITTGQLPASGLSVTITTAKLTVGGTNGSQTFTNGILTAQVQAT